MPLLRSWIDTANTVDTPFPLNNLPCGVFSVPCLPPRCGTAIGERILDLTTLEAAGLIALPGGPVFDAPSWNALMARGPQVWAALRSRLTTLLAENAPDRDAVEPHLTALADATLHLPFHVSEFTDFYASRDHARNVGTMLRGTADALPPNWDSMPIGYNGRASTVVVGGTGIIRPNGQTRTGDAPPTFGPCARLDFELELGSVVGVPSTMGRPLTVAEADAAIFGHVLLNDWSARDIQAWEYRPLGPFQAKAFATSIGPWIVTRAALEPFRVATPPRDAPLLPYLAEPGPMAHDLDLNVTLAPAGRPATQITRTNARRLTYSAAQMLAHHASSGCAMRVGDLLGSGTVSGPVEEERGSMMERSWNGTAPLTLETGEARTFLQDGDTVTLYGAARGDGYTIGFGTCAGTVLPAVGFPAG